MLIHLAYPCGQLTKIGAERDTLLAHGPELATVSCRPAHILGHGEWDKLVGYLKGVDVCFGSGFKLPTSVEKAAKMSMVWVENCALGHIVSDASCRPLARTSPELRP